MAKIKSAQVEKSSSDLRKTTAALVIRYFSIVPPLVLVIILVVGYFLLLSPRYGRVLMELEKFKLEKDAELVAYTEYYDRLDSLKKAYDRIDTDNIEKLNFLLPTGNDAEAFMSRLSVLVKSRGMVLRQINWSVPAVPGSANAAKQANDGIKELAFDLTIEGVTYEGFKGLLDALETSLRLVDVQRIDFSPSNMTANLGLKVYYYE